MQHNISVGLFPLLLLVHETKKNQQATTNATNSEHSSGQIKIPLYTNGRSGTRYRLTIPFLRLIKDNELLEYQFDNQQEAITLTVPEGEWLICLPHSWNIYKQTTTKESLMLNVQMLSSYNQQIIVQKNAVSSVNLHFMGLEEFHFSQQTTPTNV